MKKCGLCVLLGCCLLLTGCGAALPLSSRAIVKAVFLERGEGQWQAALVMLQSSPAADAGEADSQVEVASGQGETIQEALRQAENAQGKAPFYAQNQLLLVGREASVSSVGEVLEYFGAEQASRPNMAVFVTNLTLHALEEAGQDGSLTSAVQSSEQSLEGQNGMDSPSRMVYELPNDEEGGAQGLIPLLALQEDGARATQLVLYQHGMPSARLEGAQLQLAQLFLGKIRQLDLLENRDGEELRFTVDSPRLQRKLLEEEEGPVLLLTLRGNVRSLFAGKASDQADLSSYERRREVEEAINQYLSEQLRQLVETCYSPGCDAFRLGWWFGAWETAWYYRALQDGSLYDMAHIRVEAKVQVA